MTIRTRLLVAFAAVTVLLGAPLVYGVNRLSAVRSIAVTLRDRHAGAYGALGGLRAAIAEYDRQARSYVIVPDPEFRAGMRTALATARAQESLLESAGFGDVAAPAHRWLDSLADATRDLELLVQAGRQEEATALTGARVLPALAGIQAALAPMQQAVSTSSAEQAARARDISATATAIGTGAAILAVLIAAAIAWWTTSAVTDPLRRLRRSMAAVAEGGSTPAPVLPYMRQDEIGDLSRSFRAMTERLAELERVRGEFLNLVSHDLKAPISLISSYAELIEEDAPSDLEPQSYHLLESIREHTRHLTTRVNRLLSLGRLEARAYAVRPEPVSVRAFFHGVRQVFEPQARRKGIEFTLTIETEAPETMLADVECVQHEIIDNLLSNAFKFTPAGGRVVVRVWGDDLPRSA
ncbi:MAG: HAMP domain-containing protein, partial [Gemmatimonadota bacterium]|nr:HAMP domain-containing protein [Gemmatimonadota bacterium]